MRRLAAVLFVLALWAFFCPPALATNLNHEWDNAPYQEWYRAQEPTPETRRVYEILWESCCDTGDVCQACVVHKFSNHPPWQDGWYYERDGKLHALPPHIVQYVPWTPTGKPVLFIAPWGVSKMKAGDPVCLKVPGGAS